MDMRVFALFSVLAASAEGRIGEKVHFGKVEVSKCGNGTDFCEEVCCYNGDELKACCSLAYPICDLVHGQCHKSNFEAAVKSGKKWASIPTKRVLKADKKMVGKCGDGTDSCDEVCCYNGDELKACCSYAYPICDLVHGQCHKSDLEAAMKSGKVGVFTPTPTKPVVKANKKVAVGKCGDGSFACAEVCCYNGDELKACCSYAYPICDLVHGQCHKSDFEAAMKSGKILASTPVKPVVNAGNKVAVGKCGDGSVTCAEVCCYNGDELKACCSYAYPICDLEHGQCHKSDFEAAMKSGKIWVSTPATPVKIGGGQGSSVLVI